MNQNVSSAARRRLSLSAAGWGAVVVAVVPLLVYLRTLQNGLTPGELVGGDPITHQYAQAALRIANAPGYPIFTMLGWLWFQLAGYLLPLFNPVERLTFYSTLYAIPALLVLYAILLRINAPAGPRLHVAGTAVRSTGGVAPAGSREQTLVRVGLATLGTLFFAFTYFFWYYAISSENYSSATLNSVLMIALALRWQERRDDGSLLLLAFACGLTLAHMLTVALAVPAVIIFVLGQQPQLLRRPLLVLKTVGAALLPLLSYAYVYWRAVEHPEWRGQGQWPDTWHWLLQFLTVQQGQQEFTWSWDGIPWPMLGLIANELTLVVLLGGLLGIFFLPRWRAFLLLGIVAGYAPVMYVDRYGNWFQAIIAFYPVFIIGAVRLAGEVYRRLAVGLQPRAPAWPPATLVLAVFVLLSVGKLVTNFPADNLRDRPDATGLAPAWRVLADEPAPGARILGATPESLALDFVTQVWGARRDIRTLSVDELKNVRGRPVYVTRTAMPIAQKRWTAPVHLAGQGIELIAVKDTPDFTLPDSVRPLDLPLSHGLTLAGYTLRGVGAQDDVELFWRADGPIDADLSISVRLAGDGGVLLFDGQPAQVDNANPVAGYYPTTSWTPGEVVRDDYAFAAQAVAQANRLRVVVYRSGPSGFENLATRDLPLAQK